MRRVLVLAFVVVHVACPFGPRPCASEDSCDPPDRCISGFCRDPNAPLPDGGVVLLPDGGVPRTRVRAVSIEVGGAFACGLTEDEEVFCLGSNNSGQLGIDDTVASDFLDPVIVPGLSEVTHLACADQYSCALGVGPDGRAVYCWGVNVAGQLGIPSGNPPDGNLAHVALPALFEENLVAIDGRLGAMCALNNLGEVQCWGPAVPNYTPGVPQVVAALANPTRLATTDGDLCVIENADVRCLAGLPGIDCTSNGAGFDCPVQTSFAASDRITCDRNSANSISCAGENLYGVVDPASPGTVVGPTVVTTGVAISVGSQHGCVVNLAGAVSCWGRNLGFSTGQAANTGNICNTTERCHEPLAVDGTNGAVEVSTRGFASCARLDDGNLQCWGGFTTSPFPPTRFSVFR